MKKMFNCLPIRDRCTTGRRERRRNGKDGVGRKGRREKQPLFCLQTDC